MTIGHDRRDSETLASIRALLLAALSMGVAGTSGELILLRHIEQATQWIPIVLLTLAVPALVWHVRSPGVRSVSALQVLMVMFIAAGILGVGLHYIGNVEFERELHPAEHGFEFLRRTMAGATPVLAPGSMVLLGLIGLAHTYRHPSASGASTPGGPPMKYVPRVLFLVLTLVLAGFSWTAHAQTGKPVTIVDANVVKEADLAKLPHMTAALAKAVVAGRPFKSQKDLDMALSALSKDERAELYVKLFVPLNLNTATDQEILMIPMVGTRMLREFKEYRPYTALAQFHREIGKYVDSTELARLEQYVFVPVKP